MQKKQATALLVFALVLSLGAVSVFAANKTTTITLTVIALFICRVMPLEPA